MTVKDPFSELKIVGIKNREQVVNIMEARINSLEECLGEFPGPFDPLNGNIYIRWERRALLWIGRVSERLACLQEFGVLPPEQAVRLKVRAMSLINRVTEKTIMGCRS